MTISDADLHRYARQLILPNMDEGLQSRIKKASVVVVGAGGIGCPVILYLAAAGVGTLTVIDGDKIEASNLNRQIAFSDDDLGKPKARVAQARAQSLNRDCAVMAVEAWLDGDNAEHVLTSPSTPTIIVDTTDQPITRSHINRVCHKAGLPLVFVSAIRLEGQLASFTSGVKHNDLPSPSPCLACAFPELATPESAEAHASPLSRCDEVGVLGAITGVLGSMAALEALRLIVAPQKPFGESLIGKLMLFDGRDPYMRVIAIKKRTDCPVCGA